MVGEVFDDTKFDLGRICQRICAMGRNILEKYLCNHAETMWKATQGLGDLMSVPAVAVQAQRVLHNSGNINFRFCCTARNPSAEEALKCASELIGGANVVIEAALAFLG